MPSIAGRHDGRAAVTPVAIIDAGAYRDHRALEHPVLRGSAIYKGLIDTGASRTMVSTRVVQERQLEKVGAVRVHGLGGEAWRRTFLFHVAFPDGIVQWHDPTSDQSAPLNRLHVYKRTIQGGELTEEVGFDVLIGMDIITTGDLHVSRDGTFSFAF